MRVLILAFLIAVLLVFLYWRLRPYLKLLQNVLDTIRGFRRMNFGSDAGPFSSRNDHTAEKLVRCSACGTWIPVGRALAGGRSEVVFCSAECLREGGKGRRRVSGSGR